MFSSGSPFSYSLLTQVEPQKDQTDLKNLEKQYQQNIKFIQNQIANIENQIADIKEIILKIIDYEVTLLDAIQNVYKELKIFNPYQEISKISWYKNFLRINAEDKFKASEHHLYLISLLADKIDEKEIQETGLHETRQQIAKLQLEAITEELSTNAYQPPRF